MLRERCKKKEGINSQSFEDTQVEYISLKYTFGKYTFEKYALRFTLYALSFTLYAFHLGRPEIGNPKCDQR